MIQSGLNFGAGLAVWISCDGCGQNQLVDKGVAKQGFFRRWEVPTQHEGTASACPQLVGSLLVDPHSCGAVSCGRGVSFCCLVTAGMLLLPPFLFALMLTLLCPLLVQVAVFG